MATDQEIQAKFDKVWSFYDALAARVNDLEVRAKWLRDSKMEGTFEAAELTAIQKLIRDAVPQTPTIH